MSVIGSNILAGASGQGGGGYNLTRSLRFRSSASAYLNRTFTTPTDNKKWTWSGWVKRGNIGAYGTLFSVYIDADNWVILQFSQDSKLDFAQRVGGSFEFLSSTDMLFRDPSAWYHIVFVFDSNNGTEGLRNRFYVNGVEQSKGTPFGIPSGASSTINSARVHNIGRRTDGFYFDGYMAEQHFIDGQALTPSSFGDNNASTGVWQPKKYAGTYGTNGFYLPFTDNSTTTTLGNDFSGNGNNWTTNNISLTAGSTYDSMTDVPTLTSATASNFPTWNPINNLPTGNPPNTTTITNGNLQVASSAGEGSGNSTAIGTMQIPNTGKWYWEVTITNRATLAASRSQIGIIRQSAYYAASLDVVYATAAGVYAYCGDGTKATSPSGTFSSYGSSWTNGDVIGVACDWDAGTLTFYKNNTSQGTAFSGLSGSDGYYPIAGYFGTFNINFGQQPFAYTPPTGFVALNTFNLPTPTIGATASTLANKYFDISLYNGNSSTNVITNSGGMQPDLVWTKVRNQAYSNLLCDSVRGNTKYLFSNLTLAEQTYTNAIQSFNTNGYTLDADGSSGSLNQTGDNYVSWQWNAGSGNNVSNTAGSITSTVSAYTSAGFSVVTFTAPASGSGTVGHGLGVTPKMIILKSRSNADNWKVYNSNIGSTNYLVLNSTAAAASANWGTINSTVFTADTSQLVTGNRTYVAYCFSEVAGYSKFGSYTGNGSTDGTYIHLGFSPKFVMFKRTDASGDWNIRDTSRSPTNVVGQALYPNLSFSEYSGTETYVDLLSNGIKFRGDWNASNASGGSYIYMAFASVPAKFSLGR
jgi:hypothetical protein